MNSCARKESILKLAATVLDGDGVMTLRPSAERPEGKRPVWSPHLMEVHRTNRMAPLLSEPTTKASGDSVAFRLRGDAHALPVLENNKPGELAPRYALKETQ